MTPPSSNVARADCADVSRAVGEPLAGTVTPYGRWIIIEQPAAWTLERMWDGIPHRILGQLFEVAEPLGVQSQLIRRRRGRYTPERYTVFLASSVAPEPWLERWEVEDRDALEALDLTVLGSDTPPRIGTPDPGPLYLPCTHGQIDRCCSRYGNPVATAATAAAGDRAWQCSHQGGCRFAGNLLSLPDGYAFGRLDAESTTAVIEARDRGELLLEYLRGRAGREPRVQAAEVFLRRELGLTVAAGVEAEADGDSVLIRHGDSAWRVHVAEDIGAPQRLACSEEADTPATTYRLLSLTEAEEIVR